MYLQEKSKDELIKELLEMQQENESLKATQERIINEKKQMENELIKIKDKNRFKREIVANMSHELRTPLGGITGFLFMLQNDMLETSEIKKFANSLIESSNRLIRSIEDFFEFLSIDAGRKADISETNVVKYIENIYSSFKPTVEAKGIQFSFKNNLPLKEFIINTDGYLIDKILSNLISMAYNFTSKGSIEIGCVLNMVSDPVELEFYVKDTGMSIPQEKIHEIFTPYNFLYVCDLPRSEATGLELFFAKSYVELLGGTIRMESIEGKGSTFYFTIPDNRNYEPHLN